MISTTSKQCSFSAEGGLLNTIIATVSLFCVAILLLGACNSSPQPEPPTKSRIVNNGVPATQEVSQPSPKQNEEPPADNPFYGSTYWDETLTSVYFYPEGSTDIKGAVTHLKFNHREDDIWLCGDQRRYFEPGSRIKLTVTFEPNQPCATNWKK